MKITSIDAIPFNLPVRRAFRWNGLQQGLGQFVLVRVRTDAGLVGYGDVVPLADWGGDYARRSGETRETVVAIISTKLAPALLGTDPRLISQAHAAMERFVRGHTYAKCGIEMALYDILGKSVGAPIHMLLGGRSRESVPVAHMIGLMPLDEGIAEAEAAAADGIRAFQIKGGEDAARDIELTRELRKRLGKDVMLRLDANQGYRNAKTALTVLRELDDCLDYVEQPVEGLHEMAATTARTSVKVVADESCWTPRDALDLVQNRAADCISIYLAKAGGIQRAWAVSMIAEAAGLSCDVNGSIESGVGNAANIQFALACPSVVLPAVVPVSAPSGCHPCKVGGAYFEDDIIRMPFEFRNGAIVQWGRPGLGVDVDEEKVKKYAA